VSSTLVSVADLRDAARRGDVVAFQKIYRDLLGAVRSAEELAALTRALLADEFLDFIDDHYKALSPLAAHWSAALLAVSFDAKEMRFAHDFLALPPLFRMWSWRVTRSGEWQERRDTVMRPVLEKRSSGEDTFTRCLAGLFIDGLLEPLPRALERFYMTEANWVTSSAATVGKHLEIRGWYMGLPASLPRDLAGIADLTGAAVPGSRTDPVTLLDLCGFVKTSDPEWTAGVFEHMALPWLRAATGNGQFNLALQIENRIYNDYVKQTETAAHFRSVAAQWVPVMLEAGRALRRELPPLRGGATQPPRVGFFLYSARVLAHTRLMLSLFEGLRAIDPPPFVPIVYVYAGTHPVLAAELARLGVTVRWLAQACGTQAPDQFGRLLCLRELGQRDGVSAMVFVSIPLPMALACAMGVAPRHIWWSVKQHSLAFDELDGYITTGVRAETTRDIAGHTWRTVPTAAVDLDTTGLAGAAAIVRQRYAQFDVLLGSMGRPEKLENEAFLTALARILKDNPGCAFLWFGRVGPPSLQARLMQLGIADRCFFEGWVDTRLYARVLDVHLDTFPFPLGLTMYESAAAGTAFVTHLSEESEQNGILVRIWPLLNGTAGSPEARQRVREIFRPAPGTDLFPCARNAEEYVQLANRLIRDADYRRAVGNAAQKVVEAFNDPVDMARGFGEHVHDILAADAPHAPGAAAPGRG